jgi:hypothetical protein
VQADRGQGCRLEPEVEDRLVAKRPTQDPWRDPVAALDHLLGDRGVESLVGIVERDPEKQRIAEQPQQHQGEEQEWANRDGGGHVG